MIAGLATGIAFVVVFGMISIPPYPYYRESFSFPDLYSPLIQLTITNLKETYHAGEPVILSISQKAAGCIFPENILVKNLETNRTIWQFDSKRANAMLLGCSGTAGNPSQSRMTMNTQYEQPLIINQADSYAIMAKHKHVTVEQGFAVTEQ